MKDASSTGIAPELVDLLQAITLLFPDQYPITKAWLSKSAGLRNGHAPSKFGDAAAGPSSPVKLGEKNQHVGNEKRDRKAKQQAQRSDSQHRQAMPQPGTPPVAPRDLWPEVPQHVRFVPSPDLPEIWARSHGYGSLLQWQEQHELIKAFAQRLVFPLSRAGTMGVLIKFADSWQASVGRITLSVYHPREPAPKLALIDVVCDDKLVAQFEAPLGLVDARFVMSLLPVAWRKRS